MKTYNFKPVTDYIENVLHKEKGVPSCDILIYKNHEPVLRFFCGHSDYENKTPLNGNEIYNIYSCTKVMTCTAAMQLVERGIIGLDDPVSKYLPAYENAFVIKDGKQTKVSRPMTIRHLFTMSGGLDYDTKKQPILDLLSAKPDAGTVEIANSFALSPLQFEPGEKFRYSLCHDVLGAVVEVASGMRFSEYLQQNILQPLELKRTGFVIPEDEKGNIVAQYRHCGNGKIAPVSLFRDTNLPATYESGGGGLYTCVEDYATFVDALANGGVGRNGNRIIKTQTIDLMRTEQLSACTKDSTFSCAAGPGYGYALGMRTLIDKATGAKSNLGEFGWDGAAGAYTLMDPAHGLAIFFAMHVLGWPDMIGFGHAPIRDLTYEALGL